MPTVLKKHNILEPNELILLRSFGETWSKCCHFSSLTAKMSPTHERLDQLTTKINMKVIMRREREEKGQKNEHSETSIIEIHQKILSQIIKYSWYPLRCIKRPLRNITKVRNRVFLFWGGERWE